MELDLAHRDSISAAFARIREEAGDPNVLVYNAGYLEGRDLPPEMELLEHMPYEMFETAQHISSSGPFLVAQEVLPAMRERGEGSILFSNNAAGLRGRKRYTGQSLYYPRVMMRTLSQALTEEYSEHGVHVANVVIDGTIDSPGTRAMPRAQQHPELIINPVAIADAFYYLHTQDKSCWTPRTPADPLRQQAQLLTKTGRGAKPSPPPKPSFRRKPESRSLRDNDVLDSRFRGNDETGAKRPCASKGVLEWTSE